MTWTVTLTGKAYKQLKKLPLDIQDLADATVHALDRGPEAQRLGCAQDRGG